MTTINDTKKDKIFTREFLLLAFSAFFVSNNFYSLLTTVPLYSMRILKLSEAEAGLATGLFVAGMLCSRFTAGKLTEKLGFRVMLIFNLVCLIAFTMVYPNIETATSLYILRVASGFFFGLLNNTLITIASSIIPKSRTGEGVGYYSMIQMTAWATGPYYSIVFANRGDYNSIFLIDTICPIIVLAMMPFLRMDRIRAAIKRGEEPSDANHIEASTLQNPPVRKDNFLSNVIEISVLPVALVCMFIIMYNSAVTSFVAPYAETIGLTESASVFFVFYVAGLICTRPLVSKLFDKKGATFVFVPGVILFAGSYLVLATVNSHFSLMFAAVLLGAGLGACQNTTLSLAVSIVPRRRLSFANATYFAAFDTCASIGPIFAGLLIPIVGYRYMFAIGAIWTIIGLPVYLLITRKLISRNYSI